MNASSSSQQQQQQQQQQQAVLLRAIAASSIHDPARFTPADRQAAFATLEEFKHYEGRVPMVLQWLLVERHFYENNTIDITIPTKLLACQVILSFLQQTAAASKKKNSGSTSSTVATYADLSPNDRLQLRLGILQGARLLALSSNSSSSNNSAAAADAVVGTRILGKKLAAVLEAIVIRDFPQRWTTFTTDVFAPLVVSTTNANTGNETGLWLHDLSSSTTTSSQTNSSQHSSSTVGIELLLECLRLLAEDCTDSDYNSKMSTARRNDVLIGLNEVASRDFLPLLYKLLEQGYPLLQQSKATLHQMHTQLMQQNRTIASLTADEQAQYQATKQRCQQMAQLVADTLLTLARFCGNMPVTWMLGGGTGTSSNGQSQPPAPDFLGAFLHLLREPYAASPGQSSSSSIQLRAVECLEQFALRGGKLDYQSWMNKLVIPLPNAVAEANAAFASHLEFLTMAQRAGAGGSIVGSDTTLDPLTLQLDFHRALGHMLPIVLSAHLALINTYKSNLYPSNSNTKKSNDNNQDAQHLQAYLQLLVQLLYHPSGRICVDQINLWVMLLRDPQITKAGLLTPHVESILTCYMQAMVRIPWDTVLDETHPQHQLLEAAFDGDEDEYGAYMADFRSKSSLLFKMLAHVEPAICTSVAQARVHQLVVQEQQQQAQPQNYLDPTNQQMTPQSHAVLQWEGLAHPLESLMSGIPAWALHESNAPPKAEWQRRNEPSQQQRRGSGGQAAVVDDIATVRSTTQASCAAMAQALVVTWNPTGHVWLKFRRAALLETLKYYWKYHPSPTLLQGIDSLLGYLGLPEEWNATTAVTNGSSNGEQLSGEMISLKKRSGIALVAVAKHVPGHLVPWLTQLSNATSTLLSSPAGLVIPMNQMHLYEFLSCVATAVDDPVARANFIGNVLSHAVTTLESAEIQEQIASSQSLLSSLGIIHAGDNPASVTDPQNVRQVTDRYSRMFTALNQLLSVGRRCNEAARKRSGGLGIILSSSSAALTTVSSGESQQNFPDEGPLSIQELAVLDPFAPLWPRIIPSFLRVYRSLLDIWRPEQQAILLRNPYQRYAYAISDDEAFVSRSHNDKTGGVFGEGGTAGSVVSGTDRRAVNLVPKWSGWFNELRNTCFQMFGLLAKGRALYTPELASFYPSVVAALIDPMHLKSMEHRQLVQFLKHVPETLCTSCPATLYATHIAPIMAPLMEHVRYRLEYTWAPILSSATTNAAWPEATRAVTSTDALRAADLAARYGSSGGDDWFVWYYSHAGLFVGDLDSATAEAVVEKHRVDLSHSFCDLVQVVLALKGEWALVLANQAKEEQATKRNDATKLMTGPSSKVTDGSEVERNADGTVKHEHQAAIDARKLRRIDAMCHFFLLENEAIAGSLTLSIVQCLGYPDAYTCRRTTKICHRLLETVAWSPLYAELIGDRMFRQALKNVVTEPKWMVGMEWDMINVVRDIYCRLVLGQTVQPGGQGTALQQPLLAQNYYEQAKTVDSPLQGGGVLQVAADSPRKALTSIPGITVSMVEQFEGSMKKKRSAKDQKDLVRDLLRIASDNVRDLTGETTAAASAAGIFDRAEESESFLQTKNRPSAVPALPEKLVTQSQVEKKKGKSDSPPQGLGAFHLF